MLPRKPISKPAILRSVCGVIGCASKVTLRLWSGQELTHRWDDVRLAPSVMHTSQHVSSSV